MTMDITSRRVDIKTDNEEPVKASVTTKTSKRPFDVAFLMRPDEKLKQKQSKTSEEHPRYNNNVEIVQEEKDYRANFSSVKENDLQKMKNHARYLQNALNKHQIFGDPKLDNRESENHIPNKLTTHLQSEQKSAFTKVNLLSKESRTSPSLSASPEINYQNSLSPSPPILNRNYHPSLLTTNQIFKSQTNAAYQNNFVHEHLNHFPTPSSMAIENSFLMKNHSELIPAPTFAKLRPMLGHYRHELSYNYPTFQSPEMLKITQPDLKFPSEIRNPAAAILSTLLPPSLAALSLPAQNICAKCNISFRMTSDLVYHMRSHHKNDAVDTTKKRREDKLKCPVCAESFRERHHLTRHMTAHQDKDEDEAPPNSKNKKEFVNFK